MVIWNKSWAAGSTLAMLPTVEMVDKVHRSIVFGHFAICDEKKVRQKGLFVSGAIFHKKQTRVSGVAGTMFIDTIALSDVCIVPTVDLRKRDI
jgi:hypothetical protein